MDDNFERWWKNLPSGMKRGDKVRAKSRFERIVGDGEYDQLQAALNAYIEDQSANTWRAYQYCASWLGSAKDPRWKDWLQAGHVTPERPPLLAVNVIDEGELEVRAGRLWRINQREGQPRTMDECRTAMRSLMEGER